MFKDLYVMFILFIFCLSWICFAPSKIGEDKYIDVYSRNKYLIFSMLLLLLIHLLRDPFSFSDCPVYFKVYGRIAEHSYVFLLNHSITKDWELGYILLNKTLSLFFSNAYVLFIVESCFYVATCYVTVRNFSHNVWMSVILIVVGPTIMGSMYLMRQYFAWCFCVLSLPFIIEKKTYHFLLLWGIACLMHRSAYLFVALYLLYIIRDNRLRWLVFFLAFFILAFFIENFSAYFLEDSERYSHYLEATDKKLTIRPLILNLFVLGLRYLNLKEDFFKEGEIRLLSVITIFSLLMSLGSALFSGIFARFNSYYWGLCFITIPQTIDYMKRKDVQVIVTSLLLTVLSINFVNHLYNTRWYNSIAFLWE